MSSLRSIASHRASALSASKYSQHNHLYLVPPIGEAVYIHHARQTTDKTFTKPDNPIPIRVYPCYSPTTSLALSASRIAPVKASAKPLRCSQSFKLILISCVRRYCITLSTYAFPVSGSASRPLLSSLLATSSAIRTISTPSIIRIGRISTTLRTTRAP